MIASLRGALVEKHPNQIVVDVNGVGYDVTIPISTYSALPDAGEEVSVRIHTHVREDMIALFGFLTGDEKLLFEKLISVSGIGPKLGITVLSGLAAADLTNAIRSGDIQKLIRIPGVGRKTAERIVLELRDKVDLIAGVAAPASTEKSMPFTDIEHDVLSALMNLGCQRPAAETAIRKAVAGGAPAMFEPLFRKALELVR